MKNLFSAILLLTICMSGCKKNDAPADTVTSSDDLKAPTADFTITNLNYAGYAIEGKNLKFNVTAKNAITYAWDFGDGTKSEDKNPPIDKYYIPCGGNYTITLTTTNLYGKTASFSKSFYVLCSGRNTHNQHLPD